MWTGFWRTFTSALIRGGYMGPAITLTHHLPESKLKHTESSQAILTLTGGKSAFQCFIKLA